MNRTVISACLLTSVCLGTFAQAPSFSGRWIITQDFFGTPRYMRLQLEQNGSKLSGELNGDKLEGSATGSTIHLLARNERNDTFEVQGTFAQGILTATMVATEAANRDHPYTEVLSGKELAEVEPFTLVSNDNQFEVEAFLVKPLGMKESGKYPLIVELHGGPHGQNGPAFSFNSKIRFTLRMASRSCM